MLQPSLHAAAAHAADLQRLLGPERMTAMRDAAEHIRGRLGAGTLWHVNSTASGGGVAEMMHALIPLYRSLGIRAGWLVIGGDDQFFSITKRLGNALYGYAGDQEQLSDADRDRYCAALAADAAHLTRVVRPADIVILHDHQTSALAEPLSSLVSATYWRCHVGADEQNNATRAGWDFIEPFLRHTDGLIFSVPWHRPPRFSGLRTEIIPPFLAPFCAKNRDLPAPVISAALTWSGLDTVQSPLVIQVSRWDRLKDMHGVLTAFADHVRDGHLALVGPDAGAIADDVDQARWHEVCTSAWQALPPAARHRISLLCLPMADPQENALLVNALQRAADVVVQKSLAEGFGLTVTEAMWKSRTVVASAVGGIREQITHGDTGLLADDPEDLEAFGKLLASAVSGEVDREQLGARAQRKVHADFLPDREITGTARLLAVP